ncbi:MAG: sigma 54-interacting transcriptional regulator [Deltaproteobacteria bacterium]|nr:sigma 54-interacting transcriptional regulator [Deltaproteobacteria bacterium]
MSERRQRATLVNRPIVPRPPTPPTPTTTTSTSAAPLGGPRGAGAAADVDKIGTPTVPRSMVIQRGAGSTTLVLAQGERYVLGRHDAADVVFDDDSVSRLHGVLTFRDAGWWFEDYGSGNGSRLQRSSSSAAIDVVAHVPEPVVTGDVLTLGDGESKVRFVPEIAEVDRKQRESTEVSSSSREFAERLRLAARTRVPLFLLGASGVGKTWSARRVHELSRLPGAFVPINCARLPQDPSSLHSELLGHVRGAYTGAEGPRTGKLVQADGGTLFLDEVESLPAIAQGFLLDVLEGSGDLAPLGAGAQRLKPLTFRLVSASKKPLAQSGLRQDLCERLAEGHLWRVPGLDERSADIPGLLAQFAREQSTLLGVAVVVTPSAVRFAQSTRWPGEVRMLRAAVCALAQLGLAKRGERGASSSASAAIELHEADLQRHLDERIEVFGEDATLVPTRGDARRLSKRQVEAAVVAAGGNQVKAARTLGIARNTLRRRLADDED